jgi:hypothetical protein
LQFWRDAHGNRDAAEIKLTGNRNTVVGTIAARPDAVELRFLVI